MERGPEVGTVCFRLTREAATISDAWATLIRERPVLKSPAPSGQSGVSGQSARSLVVAEFRYMHIAYVKRVEEVERMKSRAYRGLKGFPKPQSL